MFESIPFAVGVSYEGSGYRGADSLAFILSKRLLEKAARYSG